MSSFTIGADAVPAARAHARILPIVVLLFAVCAPMVWQLGRWPLADPDEGRNAEIAREMLVSGDWIMPRLDGLPFLDKPPVLFWAIAGAFRVFGVGDAAARVPSIVAAVALVFLTFALARALDGMRTATWAAVIVATAPLVFVYARLTIFDLPFTALVTLTVLCLVRARQTGDTTTWWPLAGLAMGVATLTKGPVGVALPAVMWLAARGALRAPHRRRPWAIASAVVVFLAVVVPWLVAVQGAEPRFLRYAIIDETLLRFTSAARFNRGGPWYQPTLMSLLGLGIWAVVLPATRGHARFAERAAVAVVAFFTLCASKRPGYLLPAIVPLAIVVAAGLRRTPDRVARVLRTVAILAVPVALLVCARPELLAHLLHRHAAGTIDARVAVAGAAFVCAWGVATIATSRTWRIAPLVLAAAFGPGLYLTLLGPLDAFAGARSTRALAQTIPPGAPVLAFKHFRPSLPFYLGRLVPLATVDGHELTSNYVAAEADRFLADGRLRPPSFARTAPPDVLVLTASSWLPTFMRGHATPVTGDERSTVWARRD